MCVPQGYGAVLVLEDLYGLRFVALSAFLIPHGIQFAVHLGHDGVVRRVVSVVCFNAFCELGLLGDLDVVGLLYDHVFVVDLLTVVFYKYVVTSGKCRSRKII